MASGRILIVDDNPVNLKLADVVLRLEGYEVATAEDAAQALALLPGFRPKLLLLDLQLPGMDGFELARKLKADPATAHLVIVAISAYAMKGDKQRALNAGCDAYVAKPIDINSLPEVIAGLMPSGAGASP